MNEATDYIKTIETHFDQGDYEEAYRQSAEILKSFDQDSKEYVLVDAILKLSAFATGRTFSVDVSSNLKNIKGKGHRLEWACLVRRALEVYYRRHATEAALNMATELPDVDEVFRQFDAKAELPRFCRLRNWVLEELSRRSAASARRVRYMSILAQITEIFGRQPDEPDVNERVLDVLITTTGSERGALFLAEGRSMKLVAGRSVDHRTINDARKLSRSVVTRAGEKGEILCCSDALTDSRFENSESVLLNKIRSVICAPLMLRGETIGAIYLDSKLTHSLFTDIDTDLLRTVANYAALFFDHLKTVRTTRAEDVLLRLGLLPQSMEECLVGESPAMGEVRESIDKVARANAPVLITGETGTGKGLVARLIHARSAWKQGQFVAFSCGTVPETLFESELFGHRKGAFTGAMRDKKGLFEIADGGTLFLDDVSNLPLPEQAKLLQAIEDKMFRRLGDTVERKVNVRVLCATNQDLAKMVEKGSFRQDLLYRIDVLGIHVPPLGERSLDIPLLVDHFLKKLASEMGQAVIAIDKDAIRMLQTFSWPGNVRELQSAIERAAVSAKGGCITTRSFAFMKRVAHHEKMRKEEIAEALEMAKGNISKTCDLLRISRPTLYKHMARLGMDVSRFRP